MPAGKPATESSWSPNADNHGTARPGDPSVAPADVNRPGAVAPGRDGTDGVSEGHLGDADQGPAPPTRNAVGAKKT